MLTRVRRPIFLGLALIGLGLIAGTVAEAQEELALDAVEATCVASATRLCLKGGRFAVDVSWLTPAGAAGADHAVQLTERLFLPAAIDVEFLAPRWT